MRALGWLLGLELVSILPVLGGPTPRTPQENRLVALLQSDSEDGRVVLLLCRSKCLRYKNDIGKWVREHNTDFGLKPADALQFRSHLYRKDLKFLDLDRIIRNKRTAAVYIVGGHSFEYKNNIHINSRDEFKEWLSALENLTSNAPADHIQLDALLNQATECENATKFLTVLHDPHTCPEPRLPNLVRSLKTHPQVDVIELKRPLTSEMEAVLQWRMPTLSGSCKTVIYMNKQAYYELHSALLEWDPGDCGQVREDHRIRGGLTSIQLEYLSEERSVLKIQENQVYVVVGAIGGIAVIALAISIFWGLQSA